MCWLSRCNHLYIPRSHPTECVFCSTCPIILFFGKAKFSFYKFQLEGGNAVIFHALHENDLKTNKQSQKAFRRQNVQYSRKICVRLTVFVLNQVRVFVSRAYTGRHTQHAQIWLLHKKIFSEEKIIISTSDKYCAFIIVKFYTVLQQVHK